MEKKNHFIEMPFHYNSDRLTVIEKEVHKTIKQESLDYLRIAIPFWRRFWRIFRVPSIHTYYQKEKNRLVNELHSKTASIKSNVETFKDVRFSYIELTAIPTDKNYMSFVQTGQIRQKHSHAIFINQHKTELINGTRNEAFVLREQQRLHSEQIRHIESEKIVEQVRNNTIGTQLESYKNNDLVEKGLENGVRTWERHHSNDLQKEQPIMDASFSERRLHPSTGSEVTPVEINDTKAKQVSEKSRFTPMDADIPTTNIPYRNDLPPYLNGECQFTLAMDYYARTYASIHFPKECPEDDVEYVSSDISSSDSLYMPAIKQNMLGGTSLWFTVFLFLCCIGVMLYEGTLFQQVLTELFQLSGFKVWFALFIPLIIAETISILQYGLIKKMIKRQSLNWRGVITSRYFIVLLVGLICITSCLGILYYHSLSKKQDMKELTVLANDISKLHNQKMLNEEFSDQEKLSHLEQEYEIKRKAIFEKSPFMEAMKMTVLALISGFFLLATSLCLSYTMLSFRSIFLRRKIARIRKQNSRAISRTHQIRTTLSTLREKGYYITCLKAKILFLKSLHGSVPASAIYESPNKEEFPLPLNDKAV